VGTVSAAEVEVTDAAWGDRLRRKGVYVWREDATAVVVFSRHCTDMGCPVQWDPGSEWFYCPCHGGVFSQEGEPKAGPPKFPLYRYRFRVRDGELEIDLRSIPPAA
jgi:menaquinol-cytochrome c reductase iron-sulfur subunit